MGIEKEEKSGEVDPGKEAGHRAGGSGEHAFPIH